MSLSATGLDYAAQLGLIMLRSAEETIGQNGIDIILAVAGGEKGRPGGIFSFGQRFSFDMLGTLQTALEQAYGTQAGRGIALRIGRCSFHHILRDYGSELGLNDLSFRLMPLSLKLERGMSTLADFLGAYTGQQIKVNKTGKRYVWEVEQCLLCDGRRNESPICYLMVGLLQESLYWVSGGKIFNIEETACLACGDPQCRFEIDQTPFG